MVLQIAINRITVYGFPQTKAEKVIHHHHMYVFGRDHCIIVVIVAEEAEERTDEAFPPLYSIHTHGKQKTGPFTADRAPSDL